MRENIIIWFVGNIEKNNYSSSDCLEAWGRRMVGVCEGKSKWIKNIILEIKGVRRFRYRWVWYLGFEI